MKTKLDCHYVFVGMPARAGYLAELDPAEAKKAALRRARDKIRETLRQRLGDWPVLTTRRELFEGPFIQLGAAQASEASFRPKFRMQGSFAYGTLNRPQYIPPQDVDLDDGMFTPTSFVNLGGRVRPSVASSGLFKLAERILEPLCVTEGWTLDRSKDACIRICIGPDSHIDLPLYAIPDNEFRQLVEKATAAGAARGLETKTLYEGVEFLSASYKELAEDTLMLAHRKLGWIRSDPRQLDDWFANAMKIHGEVLRRCCRYLKGWRDYQWQQGRLSSIALMACAVRALDELKGPVPQDRDDVALLHIAEWLPLLLQGPIANPAPEFPPLDEGWSDEERADMVARAKELLDLLKKALHAGYHKGLALRRIADAFGERIPQDEFLVRITDEEDEIAYYEPARVAAPMVPKTTSG